MDIAKVAAEDLPEPEGEFKCSWTLVQRAIPTIGPARAAAKVVRAA